MYSLSQYSNNYWKTFETLWQYYRDKLALNDASAVCNFPGSLSFKFEQKITSQTGTGSNGTIQIFK